MAEGVESPGGHNRQSNRGEVGDARRVIFKLHSLAMDPLNRPFIARDDGCLRNIMRTLDFPALDAVYKALETLSYLCSHSVENRQLLAQLPGLKQRVKKLADEEDQDQDVKSLALHLFTTLQQQEAAQTNPSAPAPGTPSAPAAKPSSPPPKSNGAPARPVFTYMFRVVGLTGEEDKTRLERTLIRVRGVISVSLDRIELGDVGVMRILAQRVINVRAVVRARCPADDIVAACQGAEFNARVYDAGAGGGHRGEQGHGAATPRGSQQPPPAAAAAAHGSGAYTSDAATPISERSHPEAPESPRYLTPPDLYDGGDRVLVSMEDKTIGEKEGEEALSWIQKLGRVLLW